MWGFRKYGKNRLVKRGGIGVIWRNRRIRPNLRVISTQD